MKATAQPASTERDGQRNFDLEIGSWNIHLKRLDGRLVGSTKWVEFDGTSVTRKVWDGRADLNEFEVDSPTGHIEGLTLRLYNPQTRQWSIYWANGKDGILGRAHRRRIQEWTWRVLRHGTIRPEWQKHSASIHLVEHQHEYAAL